MITPHTSHPISSFSSSSNNDNNNNNNNTSIQFCIIYVPSQHLQGQLQTQHSVDTGQTQHEDNSHI
jgi:hypothetical protein